MLETLVEPTSLIMEQNLGLDNQQERRETAIRLAAFYEGEGTFVVSLYERHDKSVQLTPVINLGNCDPQALEEMVRILEIHNVGHRIWIQKKYSEKHAQMAVLSVSGYKRISSFLEAFGDFFFGRKRANVKLFKKYLPLLTQQRPPSKGVKFQEDRDQVRKVMYEFRDANKELNRLGVSRFLIDYTPSAI